MNYMVIQKRAKYSTKTFEDFSISGFSVNTQNGSITSNLKAQGSNPVPSLTVSYVSSPFN